MAPELRQRLHDAVRWEVGLVGALVAVIVFGVLSSSEFLTATNLFYLNLSIGEVAIMALPMTLIIITGEIDLSVASILGMSSALAGRSLLPRLADAARPGDRPRRRRASPGRSTASS